MAFFTVVSPLYNKSKYIEKTLKSVLRQSFVDFEIIIVDDGSTDDSTKIVEQFKDSRITLVKQKNQGPSAARINGINMAKGDYITLLDADDIWDTNHLKELHRVINLFPEAILYCCNYQIKRSEDFITPAVFNFEYGTEPLIIDDFFRANIINYIPSSSSSSFKKSDYFKIPGYRKELRSGQDIDLWVQFALKGKVAFNPKITMTYSFFDVTSLSNSNYNANRFQFIYSYEEEEKNNASLKFYLDVNRYALVLRYKLLGGHKAIIHKLKKDIKKTNLNLKQRITINLPRTVLLHLKSIQQFLLKNKIYLSAYK